MRGDDIYFGTLHCNCGLRPPLTTDRRHDSRGRFGSSSIFGCPPSLTNRASLHATHPSRASLSHPHISLSSQSGRGTAQRSEGRPQSDAFSSVPSPNPGVCTPGALRVPERPGDVAGSRPADESVRCALHNGVVFWRASVPATCHQGDSGEGRQACHVSLMAVGMRRGGMPRDKTEGVAGAYGSMASTT